MERPLEKLRVCAMLLNGTIFNSEHLIVALGISVEGRKCSGPATEQPREWRRHQRTVDAYTGAWRGFRVPAAVPAGAGWQ
jgi:hypothetical protein